MGTSCVRRCDSLLEIRGRQKGSGNCCRGRRSHACLVEREEAEMGAQSPQSMSQQTGITEFLVQIPVNTIEAEGETRLDTVPGAETGIVQIEPLNVELPSRVQIRRERATERVLQQTQSTLKSFFKSASTQGINRALI